jgi:phosphotransferase system enzyme I (PtsP)
MSYLQATDSRDRVKFPPNSVLIGEDLSPIELAKIPAKRLAGVVSGRGSNTSHLSILAHALGIPAVVGVSEKLAVSLLDGHKLIVDGYRGRVYAEPSKSIRNEFSRLLREERQLTKELQKLRDEPAITLDGVRVTLYSSAGLIADLSNSLVVGAEGIGLYRTELPFMVRDQFPTEEEQRKIYREVLEAFPSHPVTLRTLDAGGDKVLPYFNIEEPNPFMGWRGIRMALDHPEILVTQLRAMISASEGLHNLNLLFPMISGVEEVEQALELVKRVHKTLVSEGRSVRMPRCGVMIEVPSAVYQADALVRLVDFLSIGTNDLTQFLLAADRNNEHVARILDVLHPTVLRALVHVVEVSRRSGKPISVCGEAAGDPAVCVLLVGMGIHRLSLSASDLPRIKWVIRNFSQSQAEKLLKKALEYDKPRPIREMLTHSLVEAGLGGLVRPGKK